MKFLIWLRNVTTARHFFILVTFAIGLLCLYIYTFVFGPKKLDLSQIGFFSIVIVFVVHLIWMLISAILHFLKKEWKPAVAKSIFIIAYCFLIYFIYVFSNIVFYGTAPLK